MSSRLKHQVFISSTFLDLQEERQAAVEAVLRAGHIPAGMELFAADNRSQLDVIRAWIDESDIYMLILGSRYGSIEASSGQGYTELEYRYALDKGKPTFAVVLDEDALGKKFAKLKSKASDHPDKLAAFKKFVMTKVVRVVGNCDQIKLSVLESIQTLSRTNKIGGWERVEPDRDSNSLAMEIARLSSENATLRKKATTAEAANDLTVGDWKKILEGVSYKDPKDEGKHTLLEILLDYGGVLASGVSNAAANNDKLSQWLYGPAGELLSLGLMEHGKVPARVFWTRLQLSKEGKELMKMLQASAKNPALLSSPLKKGRGGK